MTPTTPWTPVGKLLLLGGPSDIPGLIISVVIDSINGHPVPRMVSNFGDDISSKNDEVRPLRGVSDPARSVPPIVTLFGVIASFLYSFPSVIKRIANAISRSSVLNISGNHFSLEAPARGSDSGSKGVTANLLNLPAVAPTLPQEMLFIRPTFGDDHDASKTEIQHRLYHPGIVAGHPQQSIILGGH